LGFVQRYEIWEWTGTHQSWIPRATVRLAPLVRDFPDRRRIDVIVAGPPVLSVHPRRGKTDRRFYPPGHQSPGREAFGRRLVELGHDPRHSQSVTFVGNPFSLKELVLLSG
jgi:hypothetical protein